MSHLVRVDEAVGLRWLAQGEDRLRQPSITRRQGGTEHATCGDLRRCLGMRVRAGLPHRAQLLRVALMEAATDGEVLVDPDVDAAGVRLAAEAAADDDERLLVLRAHRVEQLLAGGGAGLPVCPDE